MRTVESGQSTLLLFDVIEILAEQHISYAVIGALAASVHGVVRASADVDAVLSLTVKDAAKLEEKFRAAGFGTAFRQGDFDDPIPALLALSDSYENRVDLLVGLRGLEQEAFARVLEIPFDDETLKVIGREDFIAMKAFAGGPQDLLDARRAILAAQGPLDLELLARLAKQYGPDAVRELNLLLAAQQD
jgi:predicted nucleotidyltransferase